MKRLTFILLILCVGTLPFSCSNKHDNSNNLVTKRIQYDVSIKNLDPDMDWWVQNIEGSNREKIISDIMLQVTTGKVKAYDFQSCKPYTIEEINNRMRRVDSISMERPTPPYQMFDTIVVTEVHQSEITKLRFLEEYGPKNTGFFQEGSRYVPPGRTPYRIRRTTWLQSTFLGIFR